jgi:hypothetical protein
MDDLGKRLDEMKARQKELKAAGSLKEAELAAANAKEVAALKATQRKAAEEAKYKERQMKVDERRAEAYEYSKENPTPRATTAKPKYRQILGTDGNMISFDVSKFDDFEGDYQKALNAAITKGTSGLTEQEIEAYKKAKKLADAGEGKSLKAFFDNHTPRQAIVEAMVQNPIFGSL